jgi:hypothetical protein
MTLSVQPVPCFVPFYFNAPHQNTLFLNLRPLIFSLSTFNWLHSIALTPYLRQEYNFFYLRLFYLRLL